MRRVPWTVLLVLALAGQARTAAAADLIDAWQAAVLNDKAYAVGRAAQAASQPRRDQAAALWKPNVALTATLGIASSETATHGAQFSAPGFGQSSGVGFSTSVNGGTSGRFSISAAQPLYNPKRRAEQQQLSLSADVADLEWQAAGQSLMLRTVGRYFDLALAEEAQRVLRLQLDAVQRATTEAQDRFTLGSVPITDTYEARARLAGVRAQMLSADNDVQVKRHLLADSTGLPVDTLSARLPAPLPASQGTARATASRPLESWLSEAQAGNLAIRSQSLAAEVARQEAGKHSLRSSATVDLVAQASRDRLGGSGDFGPASNSATNAMVGIQLSVPLYTGGMRDAKEQEAMRLAQKVQAEGERTREDVAQQVRAAWLGLSVGAERLRALAEGLSAGVARRGATQLAREVGERTTLDLLNAENDAASAQLALAHERVSLLTERLRLLALTGQLDEAALRSVNADLAPGPR
ncbi:TolC family outer membrane protein [soil metagenome]